jgi:hypothetical protein
LNPTRPDLRLRFSNFDFRRLLFRQDELILSCFAWLASGQPVRLESAAFRKNTSANVRKEFDLTDNTITPAELSPAA